ncbi:MAG: hypothetical protein AB8D52_05305 [Gammaproteobacteria bacterium]
MFGFGVGKHKRLLIRAFSECFQPLKDELGNVPLDMQTSPQIAASILGVCRTYGASHNLKPININVIADAVFEELFRRDSVAVQTRADGWENEQNEEFIKAYQQATSKIDSQDSETIDLSWLTESLKANFKPATGLML